MEQREQSQGKGHPEGDWRECPLAGDVFVSGSVVGKNGPIRDKPSVAVFL